MARPTHTSSTVGTTISGGPPSQPAGYGISSGSASAGFQNTPAQIFINEKIVSRLTTRLTATMAGWCAANPASTRANFGTNPENGGMPASASAGTR